MIAKQLAAHVGVAIHMVSINLLRSACPHMRAIVGGWVTTPTESKYSLFVYYRSSEEAQFLHLTPLVVVVLVVQYDVTSRLTYISCNKVQSIADNQYKCHMQY